MGSISRNLVISRSLLAYEVAVGIVWKWEAGILERVFEICTGGLEGVPPPPVSGSFPLCWKNIFLFCDFPDGFPNTVLYVYRDSSLLWGHNVCRRDVPWVCFASRHGLYLEMVLSIFCLMPA